MHEKSKPGDDLTISAEAGHSSPASRREPSGGREAMGLPGPISVNQKAEFL